MALSTKQKEAILTQGYAVIPQVVPKEMCKNALRLINEAIGKGFRGDFEHLMSHPQITQLYNNTPIISLISDVLGSHQPVLGGQIALRYPGSLCTNSYENQKDLIAAPWWSQCWHIDGFHSEGNNNIPKGEIYNFSCLIGVLLQDIPEEFSGNLTLFPGSHHVIEAYFQKNKFEQVKKVGLDALVPEIPIAINPFQVTGKQGDIVLCHYQLAHTIAPNLSENIRYAIYFRANKRINSVHHPEPMIDIWKDWPGLQELIKNPDIQEIIKNDQINRKNIKNDDNDYKPVYVDQLAKQLMNDQLNLRENYLKLKDEAKKEFISQNWIKAKELYQKIIDLNDSYFFSDFESLIQSSVCFTHAPNCTSDDWKTGEKLIKYVHISVIG